MTSTPAKLKTLQGIFDPPKIVYRRDFVRENKLNLRELQKLTTKNKLPQQQAQSSRQSRQQQSNYSYQQRTASQQRAPSTTRSRTSLMGDGNNTRSIAQRSSSNATINVKTSTSDVRCPSCGKDSIDRNRQLLTNDADLCNKSIQTEDINDEDFLYGALKKCTSSEQTKAEKTAEINVNIEVKGNGRAQAGHDELDNTSLYSRRSYAPQQDQMSNGLSDNEQDNRSIISKAPYQPPSGVQDSPRSNYSLKGATRNLLEEQHNSDIEAGGEPLHDKFERMSLKSMYAAEVENKEDEVKELYRRPHPQADQLSVHSHTTQISQRSHASQRSKVGSHKLGSKENLNLPKYLEREKRDKAEAYLREMARDPKCPFGHILLSEQERMNELKDAENNFNRLISELNHMPMTSETLRSRMRKQEIELELRNWENKIRVFSKSSVYVPQESFHQSQHQE